MEDVVAHLGVVHVCQDGVVEAVAVSFEEGVYFTMGESGWLTSAHSDISWHILAVISNWVLELETGSLEYIVDVAEVGIEIVVGGVLGEREGVDDALLVVSVAERDSLEFEVINISPSSEFFGVVSIDVLILELLDDMVASSSGIRASSTWLHSLELSVKSRVSIVTSTSNQGINRAMSLIVWVNVLRGYEAEQGSDRSGNFHC